MAHPLRWSPPRRRAALPGVWTALEHRQGTMSQQHRPDQDTRRTPKSLRWSPQRFGRATAARAAARPSARAGATRNDYLNREMLLLERTMFLLDDYLNREIFLLERTMFLLELMTVFPGCGQMVLDVQALNCQSCPLERPTVSPPLGAGDHWHL